MVCSSFPHRVISATREQDEILARLGRHQGLADIKHLIDFSRFKDTPSRRDEVREELGLASDDFVVTFVGRLYDFKDPMTFIRAAGLVRDRSESRTQTGRFRFLLVGYGEQYDQCRELARQLNLGDTLIMTGHRDDIHRLLAAGDVFTTLSPVENCFAATILEAMTARKPVILTDAGYTAEAFLHDKYAYLIPPRDPEALAEAILKLHRDRDLKMRLGKAGPACLRHLGFDRDKIVSQTLALYDQVIQEAPGRGSYQRS